jgi:hypothetical protein
MKTILFTNARDEDNMLEWTVHHRNLGFDNIFIYDHKSIYPISKTLQGIDYVTVINISDDFVPKIELMKRAAQYAKNNTFDWLLYLDADEFLALPLFPNVNSFLHNYPNNQQICVNWLVFGSNFLNEKPKGTMLESYIRSTLLISDVVKSFVRPDKVIDVGNPHFFIVENMELSGGIFGDRQYVSQPAICSVDKSIPFDKYPAYIAHYIFQSYDMYKRRKVNRKRDDDGGNYDHNYNETEFHGFYNDIEMTHIRDLYNKINKFNMIIDFNPSIYKNLHNDLIHMTDDEASYHFLNFGIDENRIYKEYQKYIFNPSLYKNIHNDLHYMNDEESIQHFISWGIHENRIFNNYGNVFNPTIYKNLNQDLIHMTDDELLNHYINYGIYEKRRIF